MDNKLAMVIATAVIWIAVAAIAWATHGTVSDSTVQGLTVGVIGTVAIWCLGMMSE